jgi:peptidoglycan LD-endopeptidase LytH
MDLLHTTRTVLSALAALSLSACTVALGSAPDGAGARQPATSRAPAPAPAAAAPAPAPGWGGGMAPGASLLIPVQGIGPEQLRDSYTDARSGGRTHNAIDIMAPRGTPVMAAADGTIHRLRQGGIGGIAIYQLAADGQTMLYYAHLERYAAGLQEGAAVLQGQVIAYVGDTGNAGPGNYHLHFSVGRMSHPERWWETENVNPYPLLKGDFARRSADR